MWLISHPERRRGEGQPKSGPLGLPTAAKCNAVQPAAFGASTLWTCPSTIILTTFCVFPRLAASLREASAIPCAETLTCVLCVCVRERERERERELVRVCVLCVCVCVCAHAHVV